MSETNNSGPVFPVPSNAFNDMRGMTRDDIIRMAREAGMEVHERKGEIRIGSAVITGCDSTEQVTRFAALVAAAEREACASICEEYDRRFDILEVRWCAQDIRARSQQ